MAYSSNNMKIKYLYTILIALLLVSCTDDPGLHEGYYPANELVYMFPSHNKFTMDTGNRGEGTFDVEAQGVSWQFRNSLNWVHLNPMSGSGFAKIKLNIDENPSTTNSRTGIFYLEPSSDTKWDLSFELSVSQGRAVPYATPEKTTMTFAGAPSTQVLKIESNCNWTISESASWITLSNKSNAVDVSVLANETGSSRSATLYIYPEGNSSSTAVTVTQSAATITTAVKKLEFKNSAGEYSLKINADANWKASSDQTWISVSPSSGTPGEKVLKVSVSPNTSISSRSGYVDFQINSKDILSIPVTQEGYFLKSEPTSLTMSAGEETKSVKVLSNSSWRILTKPSWLTVTPSSGKDTLNVSVKSAENPDVVERSGYIVLKADNISLTCSLKVAQSGQHFAYGQDYYECLDSAQTISINIESATTWGAHTDATWMSVSPTNSKGNGVLKVKLQENKGDDERIGVVTLNVGTKRYDITIKQRGKYFIVNSKDANTFSSKGGKLDIEISTSDSSWSAKVEDKASWLKLSKESGTGRNGTITVTVEDNPSVNKRSGSVTITSDSGKKIKIYIYQDGRFMEVDQQYILFFDKGGKSNDITIHTDGDISITKINGSWFEVSDITNGHFNVTASENKGDQHREGAIKIVMTDLKDGKMSLQIPVIQTAKGKTFVIKEGYGEDTDWDVYSQEGLSIKLVSYKEDTNWDSIFTFKFKISIEGYMDDEDYDNDSRYKQDIDKDGYKDDKNFDN